MEVLIFIVVAYVIISVLIGIVDTVGIILQERKPENLPRGDAGHYVKRKDLGTHNFIFLPSLAIILMTIGVILLFDRVFS